MNNTTEERAFVIATEMLDAAAETFNPALKLSLSVEDLETRRVLALAVAAQLAIRDERVEKIVDLLADFAVRLKDTDSHLAGTELLDAINALRAV